ncbi:MAG: alpha/beta hydrolase [Anaerolineales bacterium]|nr:alpha/beta hydrolase [Anaerolineales bacterium]
MLINNHQLHVEVHGSDEDPVVIFLHHGLGSTRAWRSQVPAFVEAGYRVVVYDRWGYGQSEKRPHLDVPCFEDDLADLYTLLETLNVERSTLVGHSDGGTLALCFAKKYPERVACIVTVAAHIYLEPKMEPGILGIQQGFEHDERFRKGMQFAHSEKFESVFRNWFDGWHKPEALDWDMRPLLPEISCPALIIQGEDDEHATPQHAIDIAAGIPGAELWLEPDTGHMLPQDVSDEFNRKVIEFLKRKT